MTTAREYTKAAAKLRRRLRLYPRAHAVLVTAADLRKLAEMLDDAAVTEAAWGYADQRLRDLGPAAEES